MKDHMKEKTVSISRAALYALVDDEYAWPHGHQIASWRALVRRGHAEETAGQCEGCASHPAGTLVPVFRLLIPRARLHLIA